ncbi:MAG: ATP-dependent Clp protease ATP-binding subunit [Ruminococcaceae bacterium]|nr:ATP-dependent Clp protease ATP-binding subunit [Oscillospiraceae bacterium]
MSNRFTEKAEKALNNAAKIAESLGHTYIGSEHILISLLKDKSTTATSVLAKNNVTYEKILDTVKKISGTGSKSLLTPNDMTPRCRKIVENSYRISVRYGAFKIGTEHILLSILEEKDCVGMRVLAFSGADITYITDELLTVLRTAEKSFESPKIKKESSNSNLNQYGKNLTELAKNNLLDPLIGREREIDRMIRILCRKTKNNPCLIGEAGVGKTAIVEGLAEKITRGDVPAQLKGKSIISVDLTSMVAGAKYRGDFEERIKGMLSEASKNKSIILFIDEIHTIVGAGSAEGAIDAANILKPQLSRSEIQLIGATTFSEYHKYIEKDAALERRFQALTINEPTVAQTINILKGLRPRYEEHHSVKITDEAISSAVNLSERYIQDRYFPDKAIDIIDEACAKANMTNDSKKCETRIIEEKIRQTEEMKTLAVKKQDYSLALKLREEELEYRKILEDIPVQEYKTKAKTVTSNDIEEIINEITGIPISGLASSGPDSKTLSAKLKEKIFGQDEAIDSLVASVMRSETGINNPDKPKGIFLFIGTSGVGKTELAKALSEELFKDKKSLIRFDMSEFSEKNSVTMLIGSPPGYVGYEEGGALTEKIRKHPYSVVLFDEIEKADKEVLNLFLQIMDDGVLTDSCGRCVSFKNSYIIMTSNAINTAKSESSLGFLKDDNALLQTEKLFEYFSPEFINRIDNIIYFKPLSQDSMILIVTKAMAQLEKRLRILGIELEYDANVCEYLAKQSIDKRLGARTALRSVTSKIENKISALMLEGELNNVVFEIKNDELKYIPQYADSEVENQK